ncbi:hypothetical protein [Mucilaginibacter defluvii]|uniref:Uncharacterized protein n=1 Tax=Mucilaginibacter defluvii TaxID=1196019 RepID=A0ABP9FK58_9SPHI
MTGVSAWAATAAEQFKKSNEPVFTITVKDFFFDVQKSTDSLWIVVTWPGGANMAFRTAYSPDNIILDKTEETENGVNLQLHSSAGKFNVELSFLKGDAPLLHYTVTFTPGRELFVPFWPRDVFVPEDKKGSEGVIYVSQTGGRSGLIYAGYTKPKAGSFLYFQNLTALADYNNDTETSASGVVGGRWPELGLSLPAALNKPLQAKKKYVISDAWVHLTTDIGENQFEISKGFLNALGQVYPYLPKPETPYHDYPDILQKALHDLQNNKGCWSHRSGHPYLNAYVCDYNTPPEIMVQLAVLLPVQEYIKWSGEKHPLEEDIRGGLPAFFDQKLGTVMRWLPSEEHMLDQSEEQKVPKIMDSWYLHHPLLNLARMALAGDKMAKDLLLPSVEYAIKIAKHFDYKWPVFYNIETLETIKAEAKEGEGGEKDVAGLYAHVMLQVWELTKDDKYFKEAEKAAESLTQWGFEVFYQANNTVFAAKAMIRLYKETGKELYHDLSYLLIANVFKNMAIWDCNYGYSKNFSTFFALYPLNEAPYTAVYEEVEAFAGFHEFLTYSYGLKILPSVSLLLAEFIKYMIARAVFYYPPMLPKEMISQDVKTGEVDPDLWVALEDIHDGWEQSGAVGQEVYGAGLAFGIVPRHYFRIPEQNFLVFIDYPTANPIIKGNTLHFNLLGSEQLSCRLCIINTDNQKLPAFKVLTGNANDQQEIESKKSKKGLHEFELHGNQKVIISWTD